MTFFKHETAIIDEGALIGEGSRIWHWTHICNTAMIGKNCSLGQNVYVGNDVKIGKDVKIQNNVSVYDGVELEDEVFCGPNVVFTNVHNPRAVIIRKHEYRKTLVRKGATLGAHCTLVCGIRIGQYAFIGAGAVVTKDVPDYALMMGVPARHQGWMSKDGHRLNLPLQGIAECIHELTGDRYRLTADGCCVCTETVDV